jgi:hypothetical protein
MGRLLGTDLLKSYLAFTIGVNQGDFKIAWRFIPEYFWHTEHFIAILWLASLSLGAWLFFRRTIPKGMMLWISISVLIYTSLVIPSDIWQKFTVNARQARLLAPFLCLVSSSAIGLLWSKGRRSRIVAAGITLFVAVQAGFNFRKPVMQVFPVDFLETARALVPRETAKDWGPYEIINATFLHNPTWAPIRDGTDKVVFQKPHPFQFEPYLYEGYSELARRDYRSRDLRMRVVRLSAGGPHFVGFPGAVRMTIQFPKKSDSFVPEPFLTTGETGSGDAIYYVYPDPAHDPDSIQIGHDDWGGGGVLSKVIHLDRAIPHSIVISIGSLYSPEGGSSTMADANAEKMRKRLYVAFDGMVVLNMERDSHPHPFQTIILGMNLMGASSCTWNLSLPILSVERVDPRQLLGSLSADK